MPSLNMSTLEESIIKQAGFAVPDKRGVITSSFPDEGLCRNLVINKSMMELPGIDRSVFITHQKEILGAITDFTCLAVGISNTTANKSEPIPPHIRDFYLVSVHGSFNNLGKLALAASTEGQSPLRSVLENSATAYKILLEQLARYHNVALRFSIPNLSLFEINNELGYSGLRFGLAACLGDLELDGDRLRGFKNISAYYEHLVYGLAKSAISL